MKKLYFLCLLLFSQATNAQQTALLSVESLGGDKTDKIDKHAIPTDDGGVILRLQTMLPMNGNIQACGTINNYEHHFRKYNYGNGLIMDWERCYPPGDTMPYFLFPTTNGNFYTVSRFKDTDNIYKWGLGKEDAGQNVYWIKGYDANVFSLRAVSRTNDDGFLMAFESYGTGGEVTTHYGSGMWEDIWLLKLDSNGNKLWSKTIGGSKGDYPTRILPASDSGCYLVAYTASDDHDCQRPTTTATHAFVFRLAANGDILWTKHYGGSYGDLVFDACFAVNGSILLGGVAYSSDGDINNHITPHGSLEAWVINLDTSGNILWSNCYGSGGLAEVITSSQDGSVWISGESKLIGRHTDTAFSSLYNDVWTARIDSVGNFMSSKVQGVYGKIQEADVIFCFGNGITVVGGQFSKADTAGGGLPNTYYGGVRDIFLAVHAPWTTSLHEIIGKEIYCRIYPNPADKIIYVEMQEKGKTVYQVSLIDATGKLFYSGKIGGKGQLMIPADDLARGIYYLRIKNDNSERVEKIILQ
jgi:hypothetical protein